MDQQTEQYLGTYILQRFSSSDPITFNPKKRTFSNRKSSIKVELIPRKKPLNISVLDFNVAFFHCNSNKINLIYNTESDTDYILDWDILAEVYDHFTLSQEEENLTDEDKNEIFLPILDMKIFYFYNLLKDIFNWNYKNLNGHKFAICISHDIDRTGDSRVYRFITYFYQAIKQRRINLLRHVFGGKNYDANFYNIISLENSFNTKASWFILTKYGLKKNADYSIKNRHYLGAIRHIKTNNHEIGLHTPFMEINTENLQKEKEKLPVENKNSIGVRMHYLRGNYQELPEKLAKVGFRYDSTFGYNFTMGYRFGTSYPFKPLKLADTGEKIINIYEIPLNVMDIHIKSEKDFNEKIDILLQILKKVHGVCVINWHNNRFNEIKYGKKWSRTFKTLLTKAQDFDGWLCSIGELIDYIEEEEQIR